jgi:acetylornithine deacetylase
MNVFELTRALLEIESTTKHEKAVGEFLFAQLSVLAARFSGRVERMNVAPDRDNVLVSFGEPVVVLSTHMDTVPPLFSSREDEDFIRGRGA